MDRKKAKSNVEICRGRVQASGDIVDGDKIEHHYHSPPSPTASQASADPYVTVPSLPSNLVERPEEIAALRQAVLTRDSGTLIGLTALKGMGGIGKTVLAQVLCGDPEIKQA